MSGRVRIGTINDGGPVPALRFCVCLLVLAVMLPGAASSDPRGDPKRVLMLHSFGRDFRPWSEFARGVNTELIRQSPWPLDVLEHTLLTARYNNSGPEAPFVDYLRSLYTDHPPDIVLSV